MSALATTAAAMTPPGPGTWELDAVHFPRPASPIVVSNLPRFSEGMAEASARYGLPLDRLVHAQVDGWLYVQARAVGAPPGARPPSRPIFHLVSRLHPGLRSRTRAARTVFSQRAWRDDVERWNQDVKPQQVARHMRLLAEPLAEMSDERLLEHLGRCIATHAESLRLHGYFSIPAMLPIADLIAHVREWTGLAPHEVLASLASSSPISAGREPSRQALLELLRTDAPARAALDAGEEPGRVVEALRGLRGEAGVVARAWIDSAGYRILSSYDVLDVYALEAPFVIVEGLRVLLERGVPDVASRARASKAALRDAIPARYRERFDALFEEAAFISPLRDERVLFNDPWSAGVTRRALLEVGRRLVAKGLLLEPQHATICAEDELRTMLLHGTASAGVSAAERWLRCRRATTASIPHVLGPPPSPPPPAEWLPEPLRRGHRAMAAALQAVFGDADDTASERSVKGFGVSPGTYRGTARVVVGPEDFHRIRPGDVLVAPFTSPAYNILLPLLGAIITDRGGALSHAAIVSREYGIPGIVGCRHATARIPDGAPVSVDGQAGECKVGA